MIITWIKICLYFIGVVSLGRVVEFIIIGGIKKMNIDVLKDYLNFCKYWDFTPSFEGLKNFNYHLKN